MSHRSDAGEVMKFPDYSKEIVEYLSEVLRQRGESDLAFNLRYRDGQVFMSYDCEGVTMGGLIDGHGVQVLSPFEGQGFEACAGLDNLIQLQKNLTEEHEPLRGCYCQGNERCPGCDSDCGVSMKMDADGSCGCIRCQKRKKK